MSKIIRAILNSALKQEWYTYILAEAVLALIVICVFIYSVCSIL